MAVIARIFRQAALAIAFALVLGIAVTTGAGMAVALDRDTALPRSTHRSQV